MDTQHEETVPARSQVCAPGRCLQALQGRDPGHPRNGLSLETRILLYVVLALLVQFALYRIHVWYPDRDVSYDGPYHIAMADLFGELAWRKTFPATTMSVWSTHFADKEIGFHLLLCSLRRWAGLFGYRGDAPPFVLETACLLVGLIVSFVAALKVLRVRQAFVFLPLLLFSCPLFTLRANLVRPHCVSIMLMVLTAALLTEPVSPRRQFWRLGLLGLVFSYMHSNPHFILLPTGCYAVVTFATRRWRALLPSLAAALGVVSGLVLHPQFPNTFLIWKIQCVDVVWHTIIHPASGLNGPAELKPPNLTLILDNLALPLLLALSLAGAFWCWRRGRAAALEMRYLLLLAVVTVPVFYLSKRMIEYALPFTLLAAAVVYRDTLGAKPLRLHVGACVAALSLGLALTPVHLNYYILGGTPIPRQFAAWARERLPPGSRIANLCWDDFPHLFFAAPEFAYSYGLDPMFAFSAHPEAYRRIGRILTAREPMPMALDLMEILQARLVFVGIPQARVARVMAQSYYAIAYQGVDGWCFDLAAPPVNHGLPRPPPLDAAAAELTPSAVRRGPPGGPAPADK